MACFFVALLTSSTMMKRTIVLLLFAAALVGCHREKLPEGVLSHEAMVDFLTDAYMLEANYAIETGYNYDSIPAGAMGAYDQLLTKHGLNKDNVQRSLKYYAEHPDVYAKMHDEVLERIKQP